MFEVCPPVFGTKGMVATKMMMPSGRFTRKIHRHPKVSVSTPPSNGPRAAAELITAPQTPKAAARYLPRNVADTVDRVFGMIIAPPMPCNARAVSSMPASCDVAASNELATKITVPIWNTSLRPLASPSLPKGSSNAASTMLYSDVTHWASVRSMPISSIMVGMETLTIELSSTIMASPKANTHSAPHGGVCSE